MPAAVPTEPPPPLSSLPSLPLRLREATQVLHRAAESSGAMAALLGGRLSHAAYLQLLVQLQALYQALEAALDAHAGQPWLAGIDCEALRRAPALASDLQFASAALLPCTRAYCRRLQTLGAAASPALLGHVYTRYLGDLHGGQILRARVLRSWPQQGCRFYEFGDEARVLALRAGLRQALAAAPLSATESQQVLDEACWSFEQHQRLFEALAET